MIHLGDDFSRMLSDTDQSSSRPTGDEPGARQSGKTQNLAQEARDSTNEAMYEKGMIEPGDL